MENTRTNLKYLKNRGMNIKSEKETNNEFPKSTTATVVCYQTVNPFYIKKEVSIEEENDVADEDEYINYVGEKEQEESSFQTDFNVENSILFEQLQESIPSSISLENMKNLNKSKNKEIGKIAPRPRSKIWCHFTKLPGQEDTATCNHCKSSFKGSTTSNMIRHLRLKHPNISILRASDGHHRSRSSSSTERRESSTSLSQREIEICSPQKRLISSSQSPSTSTKNRRDKRHLPDKEIMSSSPSIPSTSKQLSISSFVESIQPASKNNSEIDVQLTKLICKEYHSLSIVTDREFMQLLKMLCPGYDLPSREAISQRLIPSLYHTTSIEVKVKLSQATLICITCDGWKSINNTYFYTVTAHYLDQNMKLHSNLVKCSEFLENHSAENISEWLDEVLKNWDIRNKIIAAVTNNEATIKEAINLLSIRHISCYAHNLNLIVQKAIEECLKDVMKKVEAIVQYFKRSSALTKLHEMQTNMKMPQHDLKHDCTTRWNSIYKMFSIVLINKEPIIATLSLLKNKDNLNLKSEEWEILEHSVFMLEIFDEITKEISEEKHVSLSKTSVLSILLVELVKEYMEEKREKRLPDEINALGNHLLQVLTKWVGYRESSELISQAIFLDPRFKKEGFVDEAKYKLMYTALTNKMRGMNASIPSHSTSIHTQPEPKETSNSVWNGFDASIERRKVISNPTAATIVELDKYVAEFVIDRTSDPLEWWRDRRTLFPNLYEIARQRLFIPATSIPCGQIFTKEGKILSDKRSSLTTSKVPEIVFLNSNLK